MSDNKVRDILLNHFKKQVKSILTRASLENRHITPKERVFINDTRSIAKEVCGEDPAE